MCYYIQYEPLRLIDACCRDIDSIAHTTQNTSSAAQLSKHDSLDNILEERYRAFSVVLGDLQFLHDYGEYWDADGITVKGLNYVDALKIVQIKLMLAPREREEKFM
jgi:hypothetical protein